MDGKTFAKLTKDCGVVDKKVTATDVDLAFAKVKTSSSVRTISYDQFQKALQIFADKKGCSIGDLENKICQTGGPQFQGTKADNVKFHDDPNQYTGMHAGKATGGEEEKHHDQKPADKPKGQKVETVAQGEPAGSVDEVFKHFSQGAGDMDGKTFAKLTKDCGLLCKKLTPTDVDLIFAKVKDKSARKITYAQFENALKQFADKKG